MALSGLAKIPINNFHCVPKLPPAVEVSDLSKHYGSVAAVDSISFTVQREEYSDCSDQTEQERLPPCNALRDCAVPTQA